MNKTTQKQGWQFDNSYQQLPEVFYSRVKPIKVSSPKLVIANNDLTHKLGLDFKQCTDEDLAQIFSGNELPQGATPIAQAYAGHQFGYYTMLGDGRAHLLGEHCTPDGRRVDIQLKGSGQTPYARRGDGRAVLGPMLREYIISEAMHALGIPTTRSLAVVSTGETVMRDALLPGAVLTRIASSHIRVGTFEYAAKLRDKAVLQQLADYVIERHYPEFTESEQPYLELINAVMKRQMDLIINWLRVGFIHGVMNTDNMTLSGETIDYGPCAFMDNYNPLMVFSAIDRQGRYAFANQPSIAKWNLARFVESLLTLLHEDIKQATNIAEQALQAFNKDFEVAWLKMMRSKLGLFEGSDNEEDDLLIGDLLKWMHSQQMDYTNTFRDIISKTIPKAEAYQSEEFQNWWQRWQTRLQQRGKPLESSFHLMQANNPVFIPRNHRVEAALRAAEGNADYAPLNKLLEVISEPYLDKPQYAEFINLPKPEERVYQTFCGT